MVKFSDVVRFRDNLVVQLMVEEAGYSLEDASCLWEASKTREFFLTESNDVWWVSGARMFDELLLEIDNDPLWLATSFI